MPILGWTPVVQKGGREADKKNYFKFSVAGMQSEGLYRVSGFSEHVEEVRLAFDRGLLTPNLFGL